MALGPATFLLDRVADDMADRLAAVLRRFDVAVDLATPGPAVRTAIARLGSVGTIVAADAISGGTVIADEEMLPFGDATIDLVVSALALQFANDLPGVLVQIRRALKPDGLFLAALLGGETLTELRQSFAEAESDIEGGVSPHVAPFADLRDLGALLQRAGFALPVTDADRVTVRYDTVFALMHDLRRMGATNALLARRRTPLRRATLLRMAEIYASASPMPTAACVQRSRSCGCQAGRRIRINNSRCGRVRQKRGLPMHSVRGKFQQARKQEARASRSVISANWKR